VLSCLLLRILLCYTGLRHMLQARAGTAGAHALDAGGQPGQFGETLLTGAGPHEACSRA